MKLVVVSCFAVLLVLALMTIACGEGTSPVNPKIPATSAPAEARVAAQGECGDFLRKGPIAFNGRVVSVGEAKGGYPRYGEGWQVIKVRVEAAAPESSAAEQRSYSTGKVVAVNLIDPFFPVVAPGDCVAAAGSERGFPCVGFPIGRISCDNFGFVADHFDVLTAE
jgi:hypothetical protein